MFNGKSTGITIGVLFVTVLIVSSNETPTASRKTTQEFYCGTSVHQKEITTDTFENLIKFINSSKQEANSLGQILVTRLSIEPVWYCDGHGTPSVLDGFPEININWTNVIFDPFNVTSHLQNDYHSLSVVYSFLEESIKDEEEREEGKHTQEFLQFQQRLKNTLCWILMYTDSSELSLPSQNLVPDKYRTGSSLENYQRDYVLAKNSQTLLQIMLFKYQALFDIHKVFEDSSECYKNVHKC